MNLNQVVAEFGGVEPIGSDHFIPMSEGNLALLEERLRCRFPADYRQFLMTYGVCGPKNIVEFTFVNKPCCRNAKGHVAVFYGPQTKIDEAYSLQTRIEFFSRRIPDTLIPIADTGIGNQICLGIKGNEAGKIYFWDIQNEPPDEEDYLEDYGIPRSPGAMFHNVHLIAESFEDFLQRLEIAGTD
jgi:hypothetical protein